VCAVRSECPARLGCEFRELEVLQRGDGAVVGVARRVRLLRWTSLSVPGRAQETVEEMRAIVEAIEAKDSAAAADACARHVRNAAGTALARISEAPDAWPAADS
jgi:hypothetical protein